MLEQRPTALPLRTAGDLRPLHDKIARRVVSETQHLAKLLLLAANDQMRIEPPAE